jgi:hypothetical protein
MKGGNWLDGSVEEALSRLKVDRFPGQTSDLAAKAGLPLEDYLALPPAERKAINEGMYPGIPSINDWIDKKLARYIKNEMATPEDPVRALAERGVTHSVNLPDVSPKEIEILNASRSDAGFPSGGERTRWEDLSDLFASPLSAAEVKNGWYAPPGTGVRDLANNPWLSTIAPDTPVHGRGMRGRNVSSDLGFNHLIDELRNATNPESGLPRELLLKYDALDRVTVPQAVERVAKINEWRAAQKAEADLLRANNAATVLHKEYPEGYRWVELKAAQGAEDSRKALQDALKYEGDTMGHCVGGYCDDVASGKSRIYSLRDKKGQPHTTIEVAPERGSPYDLWYGQRAHMGAEDPEMKEFLSWANKTQPTSSGLENWYLDWAKETGREIPTVPNRIVQIKGKQNRAPNPEYLPYVQDFVRSGKWSDVGDLHNTGLEMARPKFNEAALRALESQGRPVPEFATRQEIEELRSLFGSLPAEARGVKPPEGFSRGGAVNTGDYDEARVNALVEQLGAEFAQ